MLGFNKITRAIAAVLLMVAGSSNAAMVNFTITGDVISGDEFFPNVFGLTAGDTITATGMFDDSVLTSGTGVVTFDAFSGNSISFNVGNTVFTASNDADYNVGGYPELNFNNYDLIQVNTYILFGVNSAPADFSSFVMGFDDLDSMYGQWRTTVEYVNPVPVPAAVWLFGSGLVGLIGFARKKR